MELAIVLIIALVVFGPKRLPELGKSIGSGMKEFKDSVKGHTDTQDRDYEREQRKQRQAKVQERAEPGTEAPAPETPPKADAPPDDSAAPEAEVVAEHSS